MDELDAMEVIKTDLKSMNLDKTLLEKLLERIQFIQTTYRKEYLDLPDKETTAQLLKDPSLLLSRYLDAVLLHNSLADRFGSLKDTLKAYDDIFKLEEKEKNSLQKKIQELEEENESLRQQFLTLPKTGRPQKYDADTRRQIVAFYNESPTHTYKVTSEKFGISTSTLKEILNEARAKGLSIRSRKS